MRIPEEERIFQRRMDSRFINCKMPQFFHKKILKRAKKDKVATKRQKTKFRFSFLPFVSYLWFL